MSSPAATPPAGRTVPELDWYGRRAVTERTCCAAVGFGTLTGPLLVTVTTGPDFAVLVIAAVFSLVCSVIGMLPVGCAVRSATDVRSAVRRALVGTLSGGALVAGLTTALFVGIGLGLAVPLLLLAEGVAVAFLAVVVPLSARQQALSLTRRAAQAS